MASVETDPLEITPDRVFDAGENVSIGRWLAEEIEDAEIEGREVILNDKEGLGLFAVYLYGLVDEHRSDWKDVKAVLVKLYDHGADPQFSARDHRVPKAYAREPQKPWQIIQSRGLWLTHKNKLKKWFREHPTQKTGGLNKRARSSNKRFSDAQIVWALRQAESDPYEAAELLRNI